ncbi:aldo/keto reductase [Leucobacter sp. HY1910]
MAKLQIPNITLLNGSKIPQLGVGTYKLDPAQTQELVEDALELGYRHIDTAMLYHNEAGVGAAIAASGVPREELFVTTKLWNSDQTRARAAFEESLERLGLDRVDLYLIHWPQPMYGEALGAWKDLIKIAGSGRATAIGVSNFEVSDLQELLNETGVVPAVNQIELHPMHQRHELREFCARYDIAIEAWSPLARGLEELFAHPVIQGAAEALQRTPAQVILRWHLQHRNIIFPKTTRRERLAENASLFDFELSETQMKAIDALEAGRNTGSDPRTFDKR